MRALLVIDFTYDFVEGQLPVGEPAKQIEGRVCELAAEFATAGDFVVLAVDLHEEHDALHPESKLFPPHNIRGTRGRDLYGQLHDTYVAHQQQMHWMDKTRYSAFAGTDLDLRLRARGITEVHLIGVCTDICVLHTAVDLYNRGYQIVVHEDAVASFNQVGHDWALGHFTGALGATVVRGGK